MTTPTAVSLPVRCSATLGALLGLLWTGFAHAGELTVDFLDVGQGDAVLIQGGGKVVLIDAGIKGARVDQQLAALGVDHLDLAITTHPHADHMGGMEQVLRSMPTGLYLDNGMVHTTRTYESLMAAVEELGIPYRSARSGLSLNLGDEATLRVLLPTDTLFSDTRSDLNSNSVVAVLSHDEMDFLLTGDAEEPTEMVLARQDMPSIDLLKVAHHGSSHSSTNTFLRAVRPPIAVISCGIDNRYGHPDPEALERLQSVGALVYRTDQSGHLRAVSDGQSIEVLELGNFTGITTEPLAMRRGAAPSGGPLGSTTPASRAPSPVAPPIAITPVTVDTTPEPAEVTPPALNLSGVRPNDVLEERPLTRRERRQAKRAARRAAREAHDTAEAE